MKVLNLHFEKNIDKEVYKNIIEIKLFENYFIDKWCKQLEEVINNSNYEYQLTLSGFEYGTEFKKLSNTITHINSHIPDTVPFKYTIDAGKVSFSINDLSELHFIYESISANNDWISNGNLSKKEATRLRDNFNDHIHHSEKLSDELSNKYLTPRVRFRVVDPISKVPNVKKIAFDEKDYSLYSPYIEPYVVYLNYNALGEDFLKTMKSGRTPKTAVVLKEYSPSFFFQLQANTIYNQEKEIKACKKWMVEGGINIHDPKNSIGHIPLGILQKNISEDFLKVILQRNLVKVEIK